MSIDILNSFELKLFEFKIKQKVAKYRKKSIFKIFIRYYLLLIRSSFFNKKTISKRQKDSAIVISHVDSIKKYSFFNQYDNYIKYKKINLSYIDFFIEFLKIIIYLYQYFRFNSIYKNQIFEAYLNSKIILNYIDKIEIREVVFFGYDYDLTFLYATIKLNVKNIETVQYCNSGFLGIHNLTVAKKIYCRTTIHEKYMKKRKDIFQADIIKALFQHPIQIGNQQKKTDKIAIYTSGYYARYKFNFSSIDLIKKGMMSEMKMIDTIKKYALHNSNIEFTLFIHLHNNIENILDAKEYFKDFLSLPNVRIQEETEGSIENFYNYDLGVCCMSEIFFDRYERGYKTILINPFILDDFINGTKLKNVTCYSKEQNIASKISYFLNMDKMKYFGLLENE